MILETKLTLPHPKPGTLLRKGLIDSIKNNLDKKLILIAAGAGYGKTTLLGQLVREVRLPYLFYDLDKSDSDLMAFYSYLINGIKQLESGLVEYSEELLKQGGAGAINAELLFGTLINELHQKRKQELFIILDNYHNISEDSDVHQALDLLISRLPEKLRVIVSSRSAPPLPSLTRLRAMQDIFELSQDGLAFSSDEIAALLKDMERATLPEDAVRQLELHTGGWITGIRLILQAEGHGQRTLQQSFHDQMSENKPLFNYFANDIITGESKRLRKFMLQSAILNTLSPADCNAILEMNGAERTLKILERRNLFITAVGPQEYKYHPLFREYLLKCLKGEKTALHLKAAEYYQRDGRTERAIEHFLEAQNYGMAGLLICKIAGEMALKARFNTLDNWFQRMPEDSVAQRPELLIHFAILRRAQGRLEEALTRCAKAVPLLIKSGQPRLVALALLEQAKLLRVREEYAPALNKLRRALATARRLKHDQLFAEQIKGAVLNSTALIWMALGDHAKAEKMLIRVKRLRYIIADPYEYIVAESNLGLIYANQGEEYLAYDIYSGLLPQISGKYIYRIGGIFLAATINAINMGDTARARQIIEQGSALCQPYEDLWSKAYLQYGCGLLHLQNAQWEPAIEQFREALKDFEILKESNTRFFVLRDISRAYRYQGDYARSQESIDQALAWISDKNSQLSISLRIEQSLLDGGRKNFKQAERQMLACLRQARKSGWNKLVFRSLLTGAMLYADQRNEKRSLSFLRQVVPLAKLKGYDGILMRELRGCPKLLDLAQRRNMDPSYLSRIFTGNKISGPAPAEPLLTAQLLGGFELADSGVAGKIQLKRKTTKAILAFFLLHPGKGFSWEEVAAWAWPDSPAEVSHQMFKNTMWEIHHNVPSLKPVITYEDGRYLLKPGPQIRVDALEFHDIVIKATTSAEASEKLALFEKAVVQYRGPLLPGIYYIWVDDMRNVFEEEFVRVLLFLSRTYFAAGEYQKSADCCQSCIKADELNEDVHRMLLASYIKLGLKSHALKHYAKLKNILRKQLHQEPSAETASLINNLQ